MERKARRTRGHDIPDGGITAFPAPARHLPPPAQAVLDGLLLALLGRRRLLVLTGGDGLRPGVAGAAAARAAADGALLLPAVARPGMGVEDLIRQGGAAAFAPGETPADFDALVAALDERLDFAGSGVLAVEEAHRLSPATIADLVELSREETVHGRFLQILLSGDGELERTLARPGLERALRDLGVVYRLDTPDAQPRPRPAAEPAILFPEPEEDGRWSEPMVFPTATPLVRARRSMAGAWVTGAVLLAAAGTGLAMSLPDGPWKERLHGTAAAATATTAAWAEDAWTRVTALWEPALDEERILALAASADPVQQPRIEAPVQPPIQLPIQADPAPATAAPYSATPHSAPSHSTPFHSAAPQPPAPLPPAPMAAVPMTPAPMTAPPAPVPPPAMAAPVPLPHVPAEAAAFPETPAPITDPAADPARLQRVQALEEVARQQMAAKRLTTPPGDNALETVQRMQAEIPDAPVAKELLAAMADTYRRWGLLAERTGNREDARRFYERGLRVLPGEPNLTGLLRAMEERNARPPSTTTGQDAGLGAEGVMMATSPPPAHRVNGTDYGRLWP